MKHILIPYGTMIGDIEVLERVEEVVSKLVRYNYKCPCGNISQTRPGRLKSSLRCYKCRALNGSKKSPCVALKGKENSNYKGTDNISGGFFCRIRNRARKRNLEFSVSINFLQNLLKQQNFKCAISGVELILSPKNTWKNGKANTASLDRIDSSKGYIETNVQWVHKKINQMKMDTTMQEFINWCLLVNKHQTTASISTMRNSSETKLSL